MCKNKSLKITKLLFIFIIKLFDFFYSFPNQPQISVIFRKFCVSSKVFKLSRNFTLNAMASIRHNTLVKLWNFGLWLTRLHKTELNRRLRVPSEHSFSGFLFFSNNPDTAAMAQPVGSWLPTRRPSSFEMDITRLRSPS